MLAVLIVDCPVVFSRSAAGAGTCTVVETFLRRQYSVPWRIALTSTSSLFHCCLVHDVPRGIYRYVTLLHR